MQIYKSTRHAKIVGEFGENLVCNWLSRSGFEVSRVDHTGIDVVAYDPRSKHRYGITVKTRTRMPGKESDAVNLFGPGDRDKVSDACEAFGCKPWVAIYVEAESTGDLYLTSLDNYDRKYRMQGGAIEKWRMTEKQMRGYTADTGIRHIHVDFRDENWWTCP